MAVRKTRTTRSSPPGENQTEQPQASRPEARRPESEAPRASRPETRQPEKGEERSGISATMASVKSTGGTLAITIPSSSFAPVKYGSFSIPAVSLVHVLEEGETSESASKVILAELQKIQDAAFDEELPRYLDRMKRAASAAAKTFGE